MASLILGMELIPVRILDAATQKDEMLAYQLTENLQREDLNYIDQAKGILAYIQAGALPVSQGYFFAANLDCPDLSKIFETIMKTPVTNAALNNSLTAWKKPKPDPVVIKPPSMTKQATSLISVKTVFEKGVGTYAREDFEKLLYRVAGFL